MSDLSKLRCFNPLTGKRDGGYCVWQGEGKCMKCEAADRIEELQAEVAGLKFEAHIAEGKRIAELERELKNLHARLGYSGCLVSALQRERDEARNLLDDIPWEEIEELAEMLWDQGKEWSDAERQAHILLRDILKGREK